MGKLTPEQINTLIIIERTTASISVTATLCLFTTFVFIKPFRTLSNTLIFYASFANLFANVAALIGGSALGSVDGGLCQFQGFLLEMFMQSDPFWSCAMAFNVYLVFFRRFDAVRLKKLYWVYALICYGLPFIPAIFCLFYKTRFKGKMYGNATLWCWIDNDWAAVRIYSYYAPVWISILIAMVIYLRVGIEIFQKRSQLRAAYRENGSRTTASTDQAVPFYGARTIEIHTSTSSAESKCGCGVEPANLTPASTHPCPPKTKEGAYSITISSSPGPPHTNKLLPPSSYPHPTTRWPSSFIKSSLSKSSTTKSPSTIDRIKWAYTRVALLFAISILITWVPASINRVYGLRYPTEPSFALNAASAIVLPLQGFWNTVIYFTTSLGICRRLWADWRERYGNWKEQRKQRAVEGRGLEEGAGFGNVKGSESEVELEGRESERSIVDIL